MTYSVNKLLIKASGYISVLSVGGPVISARVSVFGMCIFVPLILKAPWNGWSGILTGDVKLSSTTASSDMYVFFALGM